MPPRPLHLTDDAGVPWLVIDERHEALSPHPSPRSSPGTDPRATSRLFARRVEDGAWDVWSCALFRADDRTDLSRATLLRQLRETTGPWPRPGETCSAYLARMRADGPGLFLPPAWPTPLPYVPRRGWSQLLD